MATEHSSSLPLGKYLASSDKKVRDKAIQSLSAFLSDPSDDALPPEDMTKLWKGVFYCFWMSDKPLVQQALASDLAELLLKIPSTHLSIAFLGGFWEAITREWSGIDRLRIDKYYMLIRRFVNATFRLLLRNGWELETCEQYNGILSKRGGPLCHNDTRVLPSLPFHLCDIYLEELDKVSSAHPEATPAPLWTLLLPFVTLAAHTSSSTTFKHLQTNLFDPLLGALSRPTAPVSAEGEAPSRKRARQDTSEFPHLVANACLENPAAEARSRPSELRKGVLKRIFAVASDEATKDFNRRRLYAVWKMGVADEDEDHSS